MRSVNVDKNELLVKLQQNREEHIRLYAIAVTGYLKSTTEELEAATIKLQGGDLEPVYIHSSPPKSYVASYDRAIQMLEMHQGVSVDIDEERFANYVMDDWKWKREFFTSVTTYGKGQFRAPDATPSFYDR